MKHVKYKALALDLDGTLTDSSKKLPARNKEAIFRAMEQGVIIILASGRPTMGITGLAKELEFDKRGGLIAAFNGGKIINFQNGEIIQQLLFPPEVIEDACAIVRKHGCQPLSYTDNRIVAECASDQYVQKECICNYTTCLEVRSLPDFLDYPTPKLLATGEHERLLKVREEFLEKYSDRCDSFFAESYFLELAPKGVAKDKALAKICTYLGITRQELIACGDGLNDIEMLEYAGLGVAMKNAYPETLQKADVTAPFTNDECGVAWTIENFILS